MTGTLRAPRCTATPTAIAPPRHTDPDRLLVLTLAVILIQNHAPLELIAALLYVAM